jgi:phosphate-selective porin OprO/OprP
MSRLAGNLLWTIARGAVVVVAAFVVGPAHAQPPAGTLVSLPAIEPANPALFSHGDAYPATSSTSTSSEMASVLQRLEALEQNAAQPSAAGAKPAGEMANDGWTDLSGEKWTVKLGGHVQMDYIQWAHADPPVPGENYFDFRRLRLLADGAGYGQYDFRLQIDIASETDDAGIVSPFVEVKDAYLSMNELPVIDRWRIGNFFVPFSLEQVTNDTNNIFLERSIPTQGVFAGGREVGMAMYAVSDDQNATLSGGVFFDSISDGLKQRIDENLGTRVSGRLTWLPYYDEPSDGRYLIHTGIGILYTDDANNRVSFRTRPQIHEGPNLIDSGSHDASDYTTGNIELATVWGPFSVQSELFLSSVDLDTGDNATLYGGYVYGSWFLTGENRIYERYGQHGAQFARNVPYTNFFLVPGCCGSGAWEAKARLSYLGLKELNAGQYNDLTLGFNWYWTERIRVMFDWIHPVTSVGTPFGNTQSDIVGMRFDFNW